MTKPQEKAVEVFADKMEAIVRDRFSGDIKELIVRLIDRAYKETTEELKGKKGKK